MIETLAAPVSGRGPLRWNSVEQVPRSNKVLVQKPVSPLTQIPSVTSNGTIFQRKKFSYIKWETDATYCDLNQRLIRPGSQPNPLEFLDTLKLLGHKSPNLRILELGSGQDETMHLCLEAFRTEYGEQLYSTYTLATTSLDTAFRAKIKSKGACKVNVVLLDIDQSPQNQLLQDAAYDLIIVTDVVVPNHSLYIY